MKTVSSPQEARSRGMIRHAMCPRTKKEATSRSLDRKKTLPHSPHHYVETARRLLWQYVGAKTRFHCHYGLR